MKTDIEIAQSIPMEPIEVVASKAKIDSKYLELYGKYKAKVNLSINNQLETLTNGHLILVTAMTPTKAGEGKSTTTVGLVDGLSRLNKKTIGCMREPSLGPVFGVKGGATGGGMAQVVPMEDINLHFTGDLHAVTTANNLISAIIDNVLYQGNELNLDPERILWKRAMDMNDRALRSITVSQNEPKAIVRQDGFNITVASEVMAVLCLSKDLDDLKLRIGRIIVAFTKDGNPVTINDLRITGSVVALLREALKPNLVQTLEKNPMFVHGGPFANIAHGSNSIIATRMALKLADYVVTEAGFGSDLGAQKFMDITAVNGQFKPSAVVLVATVRALKLHGHELYENLKTENLEALKAGLPNLKKHTEILETYGVPFVVALNRFSSDTPAEIHAVSNWCAENAVPFALNESWEFGSSGAEALAVKVLELMQQPNRYHSIIDPAAPVKAKIETIATTIYGAANVEYSDVALNNLEDIRRLGLDHLNVCIAKTQSSISDDPKRLGDPKGFTLKIREIRLSVGAGFAVAIAGPIMTMPGLSKDPAAYHIDVDKQGKISGLF
jgi:formate--tetrahydrofolate ligase